MTFNTIPYLCKKDRAMSQGRIIKPKKTNLPDNLQKKPLEDIIYTIIETCSVEVDDEKILSAVSNSQLTKDISKISKEIAQLKANKPKEISIKIEDRITTNLGVQHSQLPTLVKILACKLNVYLVGPSGSGKTHAAIECAKILGVPFHFTGAIASEFKLTGFIDANGKIVSTEFRQAYEHGGLFLFDEIDASFPQAVLAFNAALANDYMDFPDKRIQRHENFYCIAAANTYGQGADRQYVGRNQLDAASLDRFVFLDWKYDEELEQALANNKEWCNYVQSVRNVVERNKIRHVVSPRASIYGARLLANGLTRETVEETVLWKGMDEATRSKIQAAVKHHKAQTDPHFQKKVLALSDGYFASKVKKGDQVEKGQVIATISSKRRFDMGQNPTEDITSPVTGTILYVHESLNKFSQRIQITKGQPLFHIIPDE